MSLFFPTTRSGQYKGGEAERLAVLKYAAVLGAAYVDCEFLAAAHFFASVSRLFPFPHYIVSDVLLKPGILENNSAVTHHEICGN